MHTITLKSVPDTLYESLKDAAQKNRRSLNQETLLRVEQSLDATPRRNPEEMLRRIREMRERMNLPPVTEEFINSAKRMGRP